MSDTDTTQQAANEKTDLLDRVVALAAIPVYIVIAVVFVGCFFGAVHLVILLGQEITNDTPMKYVVDVDELLALFNSGLILVVGYELIKALAAIVRSHEIPVEKVMKIAMIALLNKAISMDYADNVQLKAATVGAMLLAVGAAYALFRKA
ncbi:MAG TPA: phosphate-starvation-inducible PsiE family protein [Rhodoblastus sp.]|nr:phosphate-starvation-inducible PsiE family protein [Rhodoblastus sp.]